MLKGRWRKFWIWAKGVGTWLRRHVATILLVVVAMMIGFTGGYWWDRAGRRQSEEDYSQKIEQLRNEQKVLMTYFETVAGQSTARNKALQEKLEALEKEVEQYREK